VEKLLQSAIKCNEIGPTQMYTAKLLVHNLSSDKD